MLSGVHLAPPRGRARLVRARPLPPARGAPTRRPRAATLSLFATYWHFLGALWVYLFVLDLRLLGRTDGVRRAHGDDRGALGRRAPRRSGPRWQKTMMWIFIVTDALLFSGLLCGYAFLRQANPAPWPDRTEVFSIPFIALMTFILITSSVTMGIGGDRRPPGRPEEGAAQRAPHHRGRRRLPRLPGLRVDAPHPRGRAAHRRHRGQRAHREGRARSSRRPSSSSPGSTARTSSPGWSS